MPTFTISVNNKVLGTYVVKKTVVTVGRSRTNTISIASKAVSRNHVRIELTRDGWSIADLGSLNGTYVNDIRITSAFISEGDKVTVGAYTISFSPEPANEASQEDAPPLMQPGSELLDSDVRVEGSPPATETALAVVKEQQDALAAAAAAPLPPQPEPVRSAEQPRPQPVIEEISNAEQPRAAFIETKNIKVVTEPAEAPSADLDDDEKKNKRSTLLRSNPAGLQLEDRIRLAVFENPLADDTAIRKRLSDSDFGGATIGRSELQNMLKKLGLETKVKRYQYFMHS